MPSHGDLVKEWRKGNVLCQIITHPDLGINNGYLKPDVDMETLLWIMDNIEVHGGWTYSDLDGWLGFDTAHYGDYWPGTSFAEQIDKITGFPKNRIWTLKKLEDEINRVAEVINNHIKEVRHAD